ncbi:MAG: 2,3-bisphosphoglycerate-independent phosphoglycerate mutase [Nanoarchaeota archaeon]|nr:2,3-bisphosphoglycerate-independent phosphoglycerate mutase [Nanoarchaeota archaeon]
MKGIFIILDGVADLPCKELGQKTPLEVAKTPNLDLIASKSKIDYCYSVKENVAPQSSNAMISLLGYDPLYVPRGPLEALGANIQLTKGDLALRVNFATIDNLKNCTILDRRAGRSLTTKEAKILTKAINKNVKLNYPFKLYNTIQHRGVLVFRGGFSDNITNADPGYGKGIALPTPEKGHKLNFSHSEDDENDSQLSAELINSFVRQSFNILDKHHINIKRSQKGLPKANIILARDAGNFPIKLKKLSGKWIGLAYMPLETGIAKATGMKTYTFSYPRLKSKDVYETLHQGLKKAIKNAKKMVKRNKKKYDYFYVHIKETDIPGHDGKPEEKVKMIETIDHYLISALKKYLPTTQIIITADHTTACPVKAHTADPVPVLYYNPQSLKNHNERFTENQSLKGKKIMGRDLLKSTFFKT